MASRWKALPTKPASIPSGLKTKICREMVVLGTRVEGEQREEERGAARGKDAIPHHITLFFVPP